ncbi:hypothetical protein D3C71_1774220 [compost metagenome]
MNQRQVLLPLPQLFAKTVEYALLDIGHHCTQALAVKFVQGLLIQIALQHRFGKQAHGFNGVHHIQIGSECPRKRQCMLHHKGSVKAEVSGIQNRMNHVASSNAKMAELDSA